MTLEKKQSKSVFVRKDVSSAMQPNEVHLSRTRAQQLCTKRGVCTLHHVIQQGHAYVNRWTSQCGLEPFHSAFRPALP